jgi:hypothetical protein
VQPNLIQADLRKDEPVDDEVMDPMAAEVHTCLVLMLSCSAYFIRAAAVRTPLRAAALRTFCANLAISGVIFTCLR